MRELMLSIKWFLVIEAHTTFSGLINMRTDSVLVSENQM